MATGLKRAVMNKFERFGALTQLAVVKYLDGEFQVVMPGDHVVCAVTGEQIPLDLLSYWSVEHQEPYATAQAGLERLIQRRKNGEL